MKSEKKNKSTKCAQEEQDCSTRKTKDCGSSKTKACASRKSK